MNAGEAVDTHRRHGAMGDGIPTELAPELEMPDPGSKPSGAGFIYFRPAELPKNVTLVHKLPHGNVDLQFSGMSSRLSALREAVAPHLEADM